MIDTEKIPATTVTIFPDEAKDFDKLDIALPALTAAHEIQHPFGRYQDTKQIAGILQPGSVFTIWIRALIAFARAFHREPR